MDGNPLRLSENEQNAGQMQKYQVSKHTIIIWLPNNSTATTIYVSTTSTAKTTTFLALNQILPRDADGVVKCSLNMKTRRR